MMKSNLNAVELTQALVRMNTVNPPGNEERCAKYLGDLLQRAGYRVSYDEFAARRTSVVASIGGSAEKPPICFTGHIDTVPLGAAPWSTDPYGGDIADGKMYGRGTSDMKSGVAAFVIAALELGDELKNSPGVELIITAGEETGCEGAFHLVNAKGLLRPAGALVVGEPTSNYPMVGHKGAFWLNAITRGVTAHGSMPERGVNAIYKAAKAVSALEQFSFDNGSHALMGNATLNVGTLHGGLNINSVPDLATIGIDIRTVPGVDHKDLYQRLCRHLGPDVELKPIADLEAIYTEPENAWISSVFEVMRPLLNEAPQARSASYFTDAAALSRAYDSTPTVVLGPGEPQMAHQTDEYCVVSRIEQAVAAYGQIMREWCTR